MSNSNHLDLSVFVIMNYHDLNESRAYFLETVYIQQSTRIQMGWFVQVNRVRVDQLVHCQRFF